MGREIKIFDVLFSCPSDVYEECFAVVNRAVEIFNREAVDLYSIAILLRHWSTDSYPQSGGAAQDLLDAQIVNNSDLAIAVFGLDLVRRLKNTVLERKKKLSC